MSKNMLIDAAHPEEIRVAVVDGDKLDKFDFVSPSKVPIKGNIYLGKIVKVEPSLQAAFVNFGGNRDGFLSFSEIHHDYFQIPIGDREELEARIHEAMIARMKKNDRNDNDNDVANEITDEEIDPREISRLRYQFYRRYKIQEVIKKRQIVLVQVTKEERGVKGAALTTYISLAGRYCVLMPNMSKGSGISRKISNPKDRVKMKKIVSELNIENGSTVIRTAGVSHSKLEIKKDFEYLKKLWNEIRQTTITSTAPSLIYEEANIIKRAIRDLYSRDIESIFVEGEEGYKFTKNLVRKLMPSHVKKVKLYDDKKAPLFAKFNVSQQVNQIYSTKVVLPSGGYLVINPTEALVSIDVNSGKSTRARDIAGTAIKTNLEAAVEIARQCRLRDLAGLIVVDFIDMEDKKSNNQVERCLREALKEDKARIQVGAISNFGLLEFSRQRMRSSIADANMIVCPHCSGTGFMWSDEAIALQILRKIEETCMAINLAEVTVTLSTDIALYLLNHKRDFISNIENGGIQVKFSIDPKIAAADFKITHVLKTPDDDSEGEEENSNNVNSDIVQINHKNYKNNDIRSSSNKNTNHYNEKNIAEKNENNEESEYLDKNSEQPAVKKDRSFKKTENKKDFNKKSNSARRMKKTANSSNNAESENFSEKDQELIKATVEKEGTVENSEQSDSNKNIEQANKVEKTEDSLSGSKIVFSVLHGKIEDIYQSPIKDEKLEQNRENANNKKNFIDQYIEDMITVPSEASDIVPEKKNKKKSGWWKRLLKPTSESEDGTK